jgi:hypothetical protein
VRLTLPRHRQEALTPPPPRLPFACPRLQEEKRKRRAAKREKKRAAKVESDAPAADFDGPGDLGSSFALGEADADPVEAADCAWLPLAVCCCCAARPRSARSSSILLRRCTAACAFCLLTFAATAAAAALAAVCPLISRQVRAAARRWAGAWWWPRRPQPLRARLAQAPGARQGPIRRRRGLQAPAEAQPHCRDAGGRARALQGPNGAGPLPARVRARLAWPGLAQAVEKAFCRGVAC